MNLFVIVVYEEVDVKSTLQSSAPQKSTTRARSARVLVFWRTRLKVRVTLTRSKTVYREIVSKRALFVGLFVCGVMFCFFFFFLVRWECLLGHGSRRGGMLGQGGGVEDGHGLEDVWGTGCRERVEDGLQGGGCGATCRGKCKN